MTIFKVSRSILNIENKKRREESAFSLPSSELKQIESKTINKNTNWINCIKKCVTKTPLRYIIPITSNTIMISYLDGERADEIAHLDE